MTIMLEHPVRTVRQWVTIVGFSCGLVLPAFGATATNWEDKVDARVLRDASAGDTEFLVFLSEQADVRDAAALRTRPEKQAHVLRRLQEVAHRTQAPILQALEERGLAYRAFWIVNMIWVRGDLEAVRSLGKLPDVARILPNTTVHVQELMPAPANVTMMTNEQWNIVKIHAPDVWALGYTGQGAVVGSQDTGFQWNHPALINQYRGWDGTNADHNYNWHDAIHSGTATCGVDSQIPCDGNGHGTHTLGVALGDDGLTNHIGVAPGAKWMGCRCMDDSANATPATYTECFEWFMSPTDLNGQNPDPSKAPDVINNSWVCTTSQGCTDPLILSGVVNNVSAAGIVVVAAAGNNGPGCSTINTPAAIYGTVMAVGDTDSNDVIEGYSSRGPVTVDGSNRIKPDVCAPGDPIYSSVPPSGYSVAGGTSNAGPHVAGLVALLLSILPDLKGQVDVIENLIEQSAVPLTTTNDCAGLSSNAVPNNTCGWGRIDALAAYTLATGCPNITASISGAPEAPICDGTTVNLTASGSNGVGTLTYSWTTNGTPFAITQSITDIPAPGTNTYAVTVRDTNGCSSGPASVMVTIGPAITGQPANQTVLVGSNATFAVQATGLPPLLYQWQSSVNDGSTWSSLSGATNTSYTTAALATTNSGTQFRAIVSETCGSLATSSVAVVTVATMLVVPSAYAQAVVSDGPFAYWRLNETSNSTAVAYDFYGVYNGVIGQAVTPGVPGPQAAAFPGFETTNTAMRLTGAAGSVLTMPTLNMDTNTVTITGWMNPSGDQSAWAGVVFCRGGTTVSGVNFGPGSPANELRFTWNNNQYNVSTGLIVPTNRWSFFALVVAPTGGTVYLGTNGVLNSVTESAALTSSAFDAPLLLGEDPSSGGRYYAGVLDEVAVFDRSLSPAQIQQLYSNALVVTGCPNITASISGAPGAPICDGTTVNLTASGSNGVGALTYRWTTNGTPFATTQSITDIPAPGTITYAAIVTDANGCPSSPVSVTVAIKAPPAITGQPTNQTVVAGSTATFSVQATGAPPLLYQWQSSVNTGGTWSSLSVATNTSYTTAALATTNSGTQFRAIVSGSCGSPVTSSVAVVTVTTASVGSGGYAQTVVSDGPFAYWRLNETNGATIADDFHGVYNGTIGAAVTAGVPGPQPPAFPGFETTNTAMRLTGAAGSVLTMPTLNMDTNTVTITGWMNPSGYQSGWAGVVFCRGGSTVSGVNFGPGSPANELRFTWNNNQFGVSTGLIVPTNQWSFFALVVAPTGGTVYLGTNGVLNSVTESATLTSSAFDAPLLLGEDPSSGGRYYAGVLDEVAVFNRSLSAAQVQQLYSNALVAAAPPAPVASFTNNPASGPAPLTVNFYDISTNSPTNWSWTFGDGSGTSTVPNPSHTYDSPRSYVVTQIVANASGSSTNTGTISVFPFTFAQWQQVYGLTGTLSGGYACYTDDGMSNTNKFMAGFSPTNAAAYLHILSMATSSTNVVVTYLGASGDTNYVPGIQSRTNVLDFTIGGASGDYTNGSWQDTGQTNILGVGISAGGGEGTGLGTVTNMTDFGGAANVPSRYYRVRVLLP